MNFVLLSNAWFGYMGYLFTEFFYIGSHGVMVSTLDFESSDPSSNLGGTSPMWFSLFSKKFSLLLCFKLSLASYRIYRYIVWKWEKTQNKTKQIVSFLRKKQQ